MTILGKEIEAIEREKARPIERAKQMEGDAVMVKEKRTLS
jgi:hypothetical protein